MIVDIEFKVLLSCEGVSSTSLSQVLIIDTVQVLVVNNVKWKHGIQGCSRDYELCN